MAQEHRRVLQLRCLTTEPLQQGLRFLRLWHITSLPRQMGLPAGEHDRLLARAPGGTGAVSALRPGQCADDLPDRREALLPSGGTPGLCPSVCDGAPHPERALLHRGKLHDLLYLCFPLCHHSGRAAWRMDRLRSGGDSHGAGHRLQDQLLHAGDHPGPGRGASHLAGDSGRESQWFGGATDRAATRRGPARGTDHPRFPPLRL